MFFFFLFLNGEVISCLLAVLFVRGCWGWEAAETVLSLVPPALLWLRRAQRCSAKLQRSHVSSYLSLLSLRPSGWLTFCTAHAKTALKWYRQHQTQKNLLVTFLIQMANVNSCDVARETNVWKQIKPDNPLLDQVRPFTLHQENNASGNVWEHLASLRGFVNISPVLFRGNFFPNKGMALVTIYVFQKLHVCYQLKKIRSHAHMAYSTLKLRQRKMFWFVGKAWKAYWWLILREPLKNIT